MSFALWLGFLLAAVLIAITPGPGAVLSMSIGMRYGYRSALLAILGLQAALLLQLVVVALGLGALLAASETAFGLLKLAGAAYRAVPGQLLVNVETKKIKDVKAHRAMIDQMAVAGDVLQVTNQAKLKEYHRVEALLTTSPVIFARDGI